MCGHCLFRILGVSRKEGRELCRMMTVHERHYHPLPPVVCGGGGGLLGKGLGDYFHPDGLGQTNTGPYLSVFSVVFHLTSVPLLHDSPMSRNLSVPLTCRYLTVSRGRVEKYSCLGFWYRSLESINRSSDTSVAIRMKTTNENEVRCRYWSVDVIWSTGKVFAHSGVCPTVPCVCGGCRFCWILIGFVLTSSVEVYLSLDVRNTQQQSLCT